jgi:hypothetical protein
MTQHVRQSESSSLDATAELESAEFAKAVQTMMDGLAKKRGLSPNAKNLGVLAATTAGALATGSMASGLPTATVASLLVSVLTSAFTSNASSALHRHVAAPPERDVWESVGGTFRSSSSEVAIGVRKHVSLELLTLNSIVGDGEMAQLLGVDRTRISQKVREQSLYFFESADGRCFPRWQLVDGKPIRELKNLIAALDRTLHPLTVEHWMGTTNSELVIDGESVTPIQWLATGGNIEIVCELAAQL